MRNLLREVAPAFAAEVAQFLDEHWPPTSRCRSDAAAVSLWHQALVARGWSVPAWPPAFGGAGWSLEQRFVWERALALAEAPPLAPFAVDCVGPLVYTHGGPFLQACYLDGIRTARSRWADGCVSLTEVGVASALRGWRRGRSHQLDGVLTGIVGLQDATHIACLAPVADAGEGFFLASLDAAGVERLDGCTLSFSGVAAHLVGAPGKGLELAIWTLTGGHAPAAVTAGAEAQLIRLRRALHETADGQGGLLEDDANLKRKTAELEVELSALQALEARSLAERSMGAAPGAMAMALQIRTKQLRRALNAALVEVAAYFALPHADAKLTHNEGPLGADYALPAIQGMLAPDGGLSRLAGGDARRHWLAAWLAE